VFRPFVLGADADRPREHGLDVLADLGRPLDHDEGERRPLVVDAQARAALAAGKLEAVRSEAEACLALTPGNLDLAILLVPELAKRGRTEDADTVYSRAAKAYADLCQSHPQSAFAHNSAAWLAACCRRDLASAQTHAEKAMALAPKFAGYRDTLAEVHFQRGDRAKAIALMKECQRMEPKNQYFVKQMQRFEAGDPSVPPPPENEVD
jgi:tetratricopeptide (TPR) repeat protein